jgi:hypothetical protein
MQRAKHLVKHVPGFWQTVQLSSLEKDVTAASVSSIIEHLRGFNLVPIIRKTRIGDSLFACAPQPASDRLLCVRVLTGQRIESNQSQVQSWVIDCDPTVQFRKDRPGNDLMFNDVCRSIDEEMQIVPDETENFKRARLQSNSNLSFSFRIEKGVRLKVTSQG